MCAGERRGERGFTLVELLLGLGLAALVLTMLGAMLALAQRIQARAQEQMQVQRWGYAALERLSRQIALAGLNLELEAGEEPFPALPAAAGGDWSSALAIQYRPDGGSLQRVTYYLDGGRLVEAAAGAEPVALTDEAVRVRDLSFAYFAAENVALGPVRLADPEWRALVRRVVIRLSLDGGEGAPAEVTYGLQTAVTVQNPCR
jgi:type II secretory pathway pseudopilin PulG